MSEERAVTQRIKVGTLIGVGALGGALFGAVVTAISVGASPGGFLPPWFSIALVTVLSAIGGVLAACIAYLGMVLLRPTGVAWATYIAAFVGAGFTTFLFAQLLTHGNGLALNVLAGAVAALGLSFAAWLYGFRKPKSEKVAGAAE